MCRARSSPGQPPSWFSPLFPCTGGWALNREDDNKNSATVLMLRISAFHLRTYQATEPLFPGADGQLRCPSYHTAGFCPLTAFWDCVFFHPDRMIYSNDLFWRGLLNPSSPPRRSIRSFHTTTDAPGSYLSSPQQGCDIASTAASSPEPFRPRGHPENPLPAGIQCLPPSDVLHDLTGVSLIPSPL